MSNLQRSIRRLIRSDHIKALALTAGPAQETVRRYVVGETQESAVREVARLRKQGLEVAFAYLGNEADGAAAAAEVDGLLALLGPDARGVEFSVKPLTIGVDTDPQEAERCLRRIAAGADATGATVTLEMQGVAVFQQTLDLWGAVHADHPRVGITLPVEVLRSKQVADDLAAAGARIRLCVGSYPVPRGAGYRKEHDKSLALVRCLRAVMEGGGYAMLASHDPTIIAIAQDLADRSGVGRDGFEFQMMMGVRPLEQRRLVDIGYRCRTYLPYGPAWFEYLTTRIAARPRIAYSYVRTLLDQR